MPMQICCASVIARDEEWLTAVGDPCEWGGLSRGAEALLMGLSVVLSRKFQPWEWHLSFATS
jgi:hypothetical protein